MADPYVYKGTNVLKNIPNILNQEKLDEFENAIVNLVLVRILKSNIVIHNTDDIFALHKTLFEEIYVWSGLPRTINIEKYEVVLNGLSVVYANHDEIRKSIVDLDKEYFKMDWKKMSHTSLVYNISRYIAKLWRIHPFREGNTRTITTYLYFFLKQNNHGINNELLAKHSKYFRNALVMASIDEYSEFEYLESILSDAIDHKNIKVKGELSETEQYKEIKGVAMEKYQYNYHNAIKETE